MAITFSSKYFFLLAVFLAFLIPNAAASLDFLIIPLLIIIMTISLKDIGLRHITGQDTEEILSLVILNYIFLGGLYMLIAMFFESPFKEAFILLGLMPPAASILSLSKIYAGNMKISFLTEFVGYFLAIILIPFVSPLFFSTELGLWHLFETILYIMIIPFILSRFLHNWDLKHPYRSDYTRKIINICYSFAFFIIIGLNAGEILNLGKYWEVYLALFLLKFGVGTMLYLIFKNKIAAKNNVLVVLFGTLKNGGAALAFAVLLLGPAATIPYAIGGIITPLFILYLEWLLKK